MHSATLLDGVRPVHSRSVHPTEAVSLQAELIHLTVALAEAAAIFRNRRGWFDAGFARLDDYARERLDRTGRWVREMAALGDALGELPALRAAMLGCDGGPPLGRVAAGLVGRVATAETLPFWVAQARRCSVSELKTMVAGPGRPGWETVELRVSVEERAAFREALDLYRAVEGQEGSVAGFVEALCAEHAAAGEEIEGEAEEKAAPRRSRRASPPAAGDDVEATLRGLVALEDRLQQELMRIAPGASARAVRRRAQVARGIEGRQIWSDAYAAGRLTQGAAFLLARLEGEWDESRQRAWLSRAQEATVKRLRDEIREVTRLAEAAPLTDRRWHASLRRAPDRAGHRFPPAPASPVAGIPVAPGGAGGRPDGDAGGVRPRLGRSGRDAPPKGGRGLHQGWLALYGAGMHLAEEPREPSCGIPEPRGRGW